MSTSGTYTWSPELVEVYDEALERCGIDPATATARHLRAARRSTEFMLSGWANLGILLWAVEQETVPLVEDEPTYNCPVGTTAILEVAVRRSSYDTIVFPMQRDEYLAIPDKTQTGLSSRYYFDRQETTPTITLWTAPDSTTTEMIYYRLRRLQDAGDATNTLDVPYRWYETFVAGLAARLALKFATDREPSLTVKYMEALRDAKREDRQRSPTTMRPRFGGPR